MKKWNKEFYYDWHGADQLEFHVAIERLPRVAEEYGDLPKYDSLLEKMNEEDHFEVMTGTNKTRHMPTRRERFIATKKSKSRKAAEEPFTDRIRPTRNGSLKPREKSSVRSYYKRYDRKITRYAGKHECYLWEPEVVEEEIAEEELEVIEEDPEVVMKETIKEAEIMKLNLTQKVNILKDFLEEYNLNTLFKKWCADNNIDF